MYSRLKQVMQMILHMEAVPEWFIAFFRDNLIFLLILRQVQTYYLHAFIFLVAY